MFLTLKTKEKYFYVYYEATELNAFLIHILEHVFHTT
jgi:hypothetical protein